MKVEGRNFILNNIQISAYLYIKAEIQAFFLQRLPLGYSDKAFSGESEQPHREDINMSILR